MVRPTGKQNAVAQLSQGTVFRVEQNQTRQSQQRQEAMQARRQGRQLDPCRNLHAVFLFANDLRRVFMYVHVYV